MSCLYPRRRALAPVIVAPCLARGTLPVSIIRRAGTSTARKAGRTAFPSLLADYPQPPGLLPLQAPYVPGKLVRAGDKVHRRATPVDKAALHVGHRYVAPHHLQRRVPQDLLEPQRADSCRITGFHIPRPGRLSTRSVGRGLQVRGDSGGGGPSGARTQDTRIKSPVLYQLS